MAVLNWLVWLAALVQLARLAGRVALVALASFVRPFWFILDPIRPWGYVRLDSSYTFLPNLL